MEDRTFAELVKELQVYQWHLETSGGEITPEIEAMERHLAVALGSKGHAIQYVVTRLRASADADAADIDQLTRSKKAKLNAADRLLAMVKDQMLAAGLDIIECEGMYFQLRNSAPKVVITEDQLPAEYWREEVIRMPNKAHIESELKLGHDVPGAKLVPVKALLMKKGRRV